MRIYVGNLGPHVTREQVADLFREFGQVADCEIAFDSETGRSRGFAYVEMGDETQAPVAITALNGAEFEGRSLVVNPARSRQGATSRVS